MNSILKVKDPIANEWVDIPAIVGPQGKQGVQGPKGDKGEAGITPHIGDNGNWFIGTVDTGVLARGENGLDAPQESILYIEQNLTSEQQEQARNNIGANIFYVTITSDENGTFVADKTFTEVMEAYEAGQVVSCELSFNGLNYVLPLVGYVDDVIAYGGAATTQAMYVLQREGGVQVIPETLASEAYVHDVVGGINFPEHITPPDTATVGQTLAVKAVDETGKPTEWEAADLPSGGDKEWELYDTITVSEDINNLSIGNLTDATSLYAKGYKELYIVYSMNPHATTPVTELRIQVNSVSGGTYADFPNYAPAAGKVVNGFLHISIMPMVRHSIILAHQKGVYAAAGIIKAATYDDRATGLYDKISIVQVINNIGAGSTFTIYGR